MTFSLDSNSSLACDFISGLSRRQYLIFTVFLLVLLLLPYYPPLNKLLAGTVAMTQPFNLIFLTLAVIIVLVVLQINARSQVVRSALLSAAAVLIFIAGCLLVPQVDFARDVNRKDVFLVVNKSIPIIDLYNQDFNLRFWYSAEDKYAPFFNSILMSYHPTREVARTLPDLPAPPWDKIIAKDLPGKEVVILTGDKDVLGKAESTLQQYGLSVHFVRQETIRQGEIEFYMFFIKVEG